MPFRCATRVANETPVRLHSAINELRAARLVSLLLKETLPPISRFSPVAALELSVLVPAPPIKMFRPRPWTVSVLFPPNPTRISLPPGPPSRMLRRCYCRSGCRCHIRP